MKKIVFTILSYLFISISLLAKEGMLSDLFHEGQYVIIKKSSKGKCPDISINYQGLDQGTKLLMLNPRIVFNLSNLNKTVLEKVSKGCTYKESLTLKGHILSKVSKRSQCPSKEENGNSTLSLHSKGDKLVLELMQNKKNTYKCLYTKGGK